MKRFEKKQLNEELDVSSASGWVDVNWPAGSYHSPTIQAVQNIGISNVDMGYYSIIWKYNLHFENTSGWGFQFKDATGDIYRCSTFRNAWHYILYNSKDPTIIRVK